MIESQLVEFLLAADISPVVILAIVAAVIFINRHTDKRIDKLERDFADSLKRHDDKNEKDFDSLRTDIRGIHERVDGLRDK